MKSLALPLIALLSVAAAPPPPAKPPTLADILTASKADEWQRVDPQDLVLIDMADGSRVAIALAPALTPLHVGNHPRVDPRALV